VPLDQSPDQPVVDSLSNPLFWHHATSSGLGNALLTVEGAYYWFVACLWWFWGVAFTVDGLPFWGLIGLYLGWRKISRIRGDRRVAEIARQKKAVTEPVEAPKGFGKPGKLAPSKKWDAALPVRSGGSADGDPPASEVEGSFFGSAARHARWQAIPRDPGSS
jgi:hypothetical protein